MADTAAHLVDRILPRVPVRQWVLSLPFALRYRLAHDRGLTADVLRIFIRAVFASLRRRSRPLRTAPGSLHCGAVTFVQRFGGALNLNVHFHTLALDGAYRQSEDDGLLRFHPAPPPTAEELSDGRLLYELRHRWRDGTTHVAFDIIGRNSFQRPKAEAVKLLQRIMAIYK